MSGREYGYVRPVGPVLCEEPGCGAPAEYVADYREDASYRYMDRWVRDHVDDTAFFCAEHLPAEARVRLVPS